MQYVFKAIKSLEVRYISRKYRKTPWYVLIKIIIFFPLVALGLVEYFIKWLYKLIMSLTKGRIKRKNKPDIVVGNIIAGFAGLAFPDEKTEVLAKRRAEICAQCPSAVPSGLYTAIIDNRTHKIQGMKCSECGCNLSAKVRSMKDYCPLAKW